jgi:Bacteriophage HK97-gp10, putative tail-component
VSGYRVSVKIDGLDQFASDLDNSPQMVIDELSTGISDSAQLMERMAEEAAPHKTGALQSSIHAEPPKVNQKTITGQVGTDLDYAEYQELGTGIYAINPDGSNAGHSKYLGKIPGVGWRWIKGGSATAVYV